jgi:hypothetical protein
MKNRTRVTDTLVQFSAGYIQWNRVNYRIPGIQLTVYHSANGKLIGL